jgi:hypothetical protein
MNHLGPKQVRSQDDASGCNTPSTNLVAPTRNLQNITDELADQPAKKLRQPTGSFEPLWLEISHFKKSLCKIFCARLHILLSN